MGGFVQGPIALAGMGSFHAGGRVVEVVGEAMRSGAFTPSVTLSWDPNGHYAVEQAYVQWYRPAVELGRAVLLVHGGGMSGVCWETTPDGRAGWVELLLRRGLPVFVVDNVERGRAGWCPLSGVWEGEPILRSAEWAWELFRFGRAKDFAARVPFAGQRFPVGALEALTRQFVPRWLSTTGAQVAGLVAAIRRIGMVDLVCHSQGGEVALAAAAAVPELVGRVVALEPSGFGPGLDPARQAVLTVVGDYWDLSEAAAGRLAQMRAFSAAFAAQGGRAEFWDMTARGRAGHSHMLMMDGGSEALAGEAADWLALDHSLSVATMRK